MDIPVFGDDPFLNNNSDTEVIHRLAEQLRDVELEETRIKIGSFFLQGEKGISKPLQYSEEDIQLLHGAHDYTFVIKDGEVSLSVQLYENINSHYRINCFSRCNEVSGQLFSMNLTTEKDADGSIFFMQKIKFSDRLEGHADAQRAFRRMKQQVFTQMLAKLGFEMTETNDLFLGVYDTKTGTFLNTTAERFMADFLMISLLKGHFMGNKGYELEILPSYSLEPQPGETSAFLENVLPEKILNQKKSRNIPLSLRFRILERDRCCKLCGRGPIDGVKLHIDHIIPYSLGGTTSVENLQVLCHECNIGKSNRSDKMY